MLSVAAERPNVYSYELKRFDSVPEDAECLPLSETFRSSGALTDFPNTEAINISSLRDSKAYPGRFTSSVILARVAVTSI
jgi:hypothetical protein